jgi:predicted glycogen debranching enzyme
MDPIQVGWTRIDSVDALATREWLVTNGLGGYAAGTIGGVCTRRFHGKLIAALPAPLGRTMMLNHLEEWIAGPGGLRVDLNGSECLDEFALECGVPVWRYSHESIRVEKRVVMPYGQNTVHVTYQLLRGEGPIRMSLRPSIQFRGYEDPVNTSLVDRYTLTAVGNRYEVSGGASLPPLRFLVDGDRAALTLDEKGVPEVPYDMERRRGYDSTGSMWSPGYFRADLRNNRAVTLVASTESWEAIHALTPDVAEHAERDRRRRLLATAECDGTNALAAELVLAADQFIITPAGRAEEAARAKASGEEARTVIAGYHWFTDWGRDTMISLDGLTLATGRFREAEDILRTFAHYVRDGLIPNMFPDGEREGLYHTADASLWFFHAVHRHAAVTGDTNTVHDLLPQLTDIVRRHLAGTRFGIHVDATDGLLTQGAEGYQLTWMDAKVDDWVVTPRRGKAVEINALWYNALRLLDGWTRELGVDTDLDLATHAERARRGFNERFWYAEGGYLFDVVDGPGGNDPALRPNQILAFSLQHPVLDAGRWASVLEVVRDRLATPVGLRSLAPGHADYKSKYYGDLRSRDAAYHQGTVWAWLIGPYLDAWLKVHPGDRAGVKKALAGFDAHLNEACVGSISEVFDAEEPYTPRGCIAQAWSVAEVLRHLR